MPTPYLVYCTPDGEIREEPRLKPLAFGNYVLSAADLLPLPDGVTLSMMPDRLLSAYMRQVSVKSLGSRVAGLPPRSCPSATHARTCRSMRRCREPSHCLSSATARWQGCMGGCMWLLSRPTIRANGIHAPFKN